tara:strand:- start:211 stop:333 length:123 start_codon:yes stop_codon:yes gene_type:complete
VILAVAEVVELYVWVAMQRLEILVVMVEQELLQVLMEHQL